MSKGKLTLFPTQGSRADPHLIPLSWGRAFAAQMSLTWLCLHQGFFLVHSVIGLPHITAYSVCSVNDLMKVGNEQLLLEVHD